MMTLDEKLVELLIKAGLRKNPAKVIAYLSKVKKAKAREIELGTDLREPELSLAIKDLKKRNWIKERKIKRDRVGRRPKEYELIVDLKDIVRELIDARRRELNELKAKLSKLERALSDI